MSGPASCNDNVFPAARGAILSAFVIRQDVAGIPPVTKPQEQFPLRHFPEHPDSSRGADTKESFRVLPRYGAMLPEKPEYAFLLLRMFLLFPRKRLPIFRFFPRQKVRQDELEGVGRGQDLRFCIGLAVIVPDFLQPGPASPGEPEP